MKLLKHHGARFESLLTQRHSDSCASIILNTNKEFGKDIEKSIATSIALSRAARKGCTFDGRHLEGHAHAEKLRLAGVAVQSAPFDLFHRSAS